MDDVTRRDTVRLGHGCARQGDEKASISHRSSSPLQETGAGRHGAGIKLDAVQQARLLAIVKGDPPEAWTRWTLPRLAEELVGRGIVAAISPEDVRRALVEAILRGEYRVSPTNEEQRCWS
jgi:hypothetical protein